MHRIIPRALAAHGLLLTYQTGLALARDTTTLTSTSTAFTSTCTLNTGATACASTGSETILITGDPSQPTDSASSTGTMSWSGDSFQSAVLNSTNYYRGQHQASALTWDDTLAKYAETHAQACIWQHSVDQPSQFILRVLQRTDSLHTGRTVRREPSRRLHHPHPRHRRLGERREEVRLREAQVLRVDGPLHTTGVEEHNESRLRRGELR